MFGFLNGRNVRWSKYANTILAERKNVTLLDWGGMFRFTSDAVAAFIVPKLHFKCAIFEPKLTAKRLYKTWRQIEHFWHS